MVKKVMAVFMAVILCLGVVLLPASAVGFDSSYNLPADKKVAYKVELDKATYEAGDTVTVSIDMYVADEYQLNSGTVTIASSSAVIDQSVNTPSVVKATASSSALSDSFWNPIQSTTWGWQPSAIVTRIEKGNTAEENQYYDQYLKFGLVRQTIGNGTHPNSDDRTQGLPASEINADEGAMWTFQFKLRDDIPAGTKISFAITQGCFSTNPQSTGMKYQTSPGTSPASTAFASNTYDGTAAVATATVGTPAPAGPAVTKTQAEVKMTLNEEKTAVDYAAAPFQFRVISSISEDDWNTYFNGDGSNIESVGFVAYKGDGAFDMETAKSVAMGGSAADYQAAKTDYIQKVDGQAANFGARIDFTARENVKDVTYIAFVQYDTDQYAFYDTSYSVALNTNYDTIVRDYAGFINA